MKKLLYLFYVITAFFLLSAVLPKDISENWNSKFNTHTSPKAELIKKISPSGLVGVSILNEDDIENEKAVIHTIYLPLICNQNFQIQSHGHACK